MSACCVGVVSSRPESTRSVALLGRTVPLLRLTPLTGTEQGTAKAPSCGLCDKAAVNGLFNRAVIKESIPSQHPHGSRIWNLSGLTGWVANGIAVSYTHLTLPTILRV